MKKSVRRKKGAKGAVERASRPRWETHCWEPFKQQRNSHSKKPTALNEAARGHSFNFRFPRFKAHTQKKYPAVLTRISARFVVFLSL